MAEYYSIAADDALPGEPSAIYGRQSLGKVKSIDEQIEECFEDAEESGDPVVAVYRDNVSASKYGSKARNDWDALLADFANGVFKKLYLWESSRGSRDAKEWLALLDEFRTRGFRIRITDSEKTYDLRNPDEWKQLADEGVNNEHESNKISARVSRGLRRNAKKGRPHGKLTFGYRRIYQFNGPVRELIGQEIDDTVRTTPTGFEWSPATLVRNMFRDVLAGADLGEIARELNAEKVPTPSLLAKLEGGGSKRPVEELQNRMWRTTQIRYILLNEAYLGVRRHHRCAKNTKTKHNCEEERKAAKSGAWPALIEVAGDFWKVHTILKDPARLSGQVKGIKSTPKYLLSCIAKCFCGQDILYLSPQKNGTRRTRAYYRCRQSHCAVAADEADAFVAYYLWKWLAKKENWAVLRQTASGTNKDLEQAQGLLDQLEEELAKWRAAVKFDPANPTRKRPSLEAFMDQEADLLTQIEALRERTKIRSLPTSVTDLAGKTLEQIAAAWSDPSFTVSKQRAVLSSLVTITFFSAGKGNRLPLEERVKIKDIYTTTEPAEKVS